MRTFLLAENNRMGRFAELPKKTKVMGWQAFAKSMRIYNNDSLWVTEGLEHIRKAFNDLDETVFKQQSKLRKHVAMVVITENAPMEVRQSLESLFREAIILSQESTLPLEQLFEVLNSKNSDRLVIGGQVDLLTHTLTLIRGDLSSIVIPLLTFRPSGNGIDPDYSKFSVEDYGQTIKLGEYEASVDSVLYEFDPLYRRKLKKEQSKKDKSFGACLRRLRIQKGLKQTDFPGINAREIGRIERGEVKPRKVTIEKLAYTLKIHSKKITAY